MTWETRPRPSFLAQKLYKKKRQQWQQVNDFTEAAMRKCMPLCRRAIRQQQMRGRVSPLCQKSFLQLSLDDLTLFTVVASRQGHSCPRLKVLGMSIQRLITSIGKLQAAKSAAEGVGHLSELNTGGGAISHTPLCRVNA